jgi:hypothetical protein
MKFSLPLTQRTQTMLRNLRNENFNKLKAKEVRYFMHKQGLNSKGIECLKGQIADYLNNEIVKRIFEAIRVNNFKFAGKGKQLEGLLEAFVSINIFCNLFLREGYSIDERQHFEELVGDFCNHFNQLVAKSPGEYLDKKGLINQLIVLNTHTHGRRLVKIIKRFSFRIFGSRYDSKKFHDYRAWASGANKYTKVTGSAKELILKIDNKNFKPATFIKDERSLLEEVKQYSESLFQWSKDLKGDLGRKLKIYNALRMAGLAHINKDLIADKDFDSKVQDEIFKVFQAVPGIGPRYSQEIIDSDTKLYSIYNVNHSIILSLLESYPQFINEEITHNLFDKFIDTEKAPLNNGVDCKEQVIAVVLRYLKNPPYTEKVWELKKKVIEKFGKEKPEEALELMAEWKITDFNVINDFMNNVILGVSPENLVKGRSANLLNRATEFILVLPKFWIELGLKFEQYIVPYNVTLLELLKRVENTQSFINNTRVESHLEASLDYQTDFLKQILGKLKQGEKYDDALVASLLDYTSINKVIGSNVEFLVCKHFLIMHLNRFMHINSDIKEVPHYIACNHHLFDLSIQTQLMINLEDNLKFSDRDIQDIIKIKKPILNKLRQIKSSFCKQNYDKLDKIKEKELRRNNEFVIDKGPLAGTACIYYNGYALVFNHYTDYLEKLFMQRDTLLKIYSWQKNKKNINFADYVEIKLDSVAEKFTFSISPYSIKASPQIESKALKEIMHTLFVQQHKSKTLPVEISNYSDESWYFARKFVVHKQAEIALELSPTQESYYTLSFPITKLEYTRIKKKVEEAARDESLGYAENIMSELKNNLINVDSEGDVIKRFVIRRKIECGLLDVSIPKCLLTNTQLNTEVIEVHTK